MNAPLQIRYHNLTPSPAIEASIERRAAKLFRRNDRILGCQVVVDPPHGS